MKRGRDLRGDVVLHREQVLDRPVVPGRPKRRRCARIDEPGRDTQHRAAALHGAVDQEGRAQALADLGGVR